MGEEKKEEELVVEDQTEVERDGCCSGYPWWVAFILGNEFCERYAYYGMRSILVLYLTYFIGFSNDVSVEIYHAFAALTGLLFSHI
ncbi:Oidioi.mRNA.OKI2018_I69.chr1.g1175.t1.cds [Oikopleura dioica]|uniref:Oidioi.mRNA.OKI2018_I69.chr1.g1175.t1.cds n=1 Tax=Oikopleura dioica TaxID=34765 RepID=A0ABN7STG6_OIKDI|nr:Oidioi.mRNA.OKI2018_I69.chr1.g1175.t1.cds [Oikopleura dioica]